MTIFASVACPESPCIKLCKLDNEGKYCVGCLRFLTEIAQWRDMTPAQRAEIWQQLDKRHAAIAAGILLDQLY